MNTSNELRIQWASEFFWNSSQYSQLFGYEINTKVLNLCSVLSLLGPIHKFGHIQINRVLTQTYFLLSMPDIAPNFFGWASPLYSSLLSQGNDMYYQSLGRGILDFTGDNLGKRPGIHLVLSDDLTSGWGPRYGDCETKGQSRAQSLILRKSGSKTSSSQAEAQ